MNARLLTPLLIALVSACAAAPPIPADPDVLLVSAEEEPPAQNGVDLLLDYYDEEPVDAEPLHGRLTSGEAVSAQEIQDFLEARGFTVVAFRGSPGDSETGLRYHLDRGRPLLLLLRTDDEAVWILLVGYDVAAGIHILQDPEHGVVGLKSEKMRQLWEAAGRATILAVPSFTSREVE